MIRASAHHDYNAGRPYATAKLVAAILALVVLCALSGIGGAWVALRITGSTSQPSPMPTETVEPEPMGTVVPL